MFNILKDKKIYINIPNYEDNKILNKFFILIKEKNPDIIHNNFFIDGLDICFPYSIWSLNRKNNYYTTQNSIIKDLDFYWAHNLKTNYIFDNPYITKNDVFDTFSNLVLKISQKNPGKIFVKSDILYDYIKKNYPKYTLYKVAEPNNFSEKNILVETKYNNTNEINKIKHKKYTYITLNPVCPTDCKFYDVHKEYIAKEHLNYFENSDFFICPLKINLNFYDLKKHANFITFEKMQSYIKNGYNHFRINFPEMAFNRFSNYNVIDILESYIYYLIKPEYKYYVRNCIANNIIKKQEKREKDVKI